jgi:hypothetical protein
VKKRQVSHDGVNWMDIVGQSLVDVDLYRHVRNITVDVENERLEKLEEGMAAAKEIADAADLRRRAFDLYRGPFRYEKGYIWDKDNEMVADDHIEKAMPALQVRGWGRMKYFADSAALQDAVGVLMAEALTVYWRSERKRRR